MLLPRYILLLLATVLPAIQAAVLAIDYGAEFTKLSLVKPGVPFDVLLDRDSKRKISSVVGWKRDDRVFGAEGKMAATRFPKTHYPYVKALLAEDTTPALDLWPSPPHVTSYGELVFPHPNVPQHVLPQPTTEDEVWTPTTLLAHQLAYFRGLADATAEEAVTQAVVTVPAWWGQAQRRAYRDALELAGLQCLAMMGEGTAAGLNFAMTRSFPDYDVETGEGSKEYYVIYDSGALSTSATVLAMYQTSYKPSPNSKMVINTTHVDALSVGWSDAGGVHLDLAVRELLLKDFAAKSGVSAAEVRKDARAMQKLLREAVRVKQILSANQEAATAIEGVYDDRDFRSMVSRSQLEGAMKDVSEFTAPVRDALASAGLGLKDISSVIMFGGNTRVPLVQAALKETLGNDDLIAQNVNADEGAVLGAAFHAAALSRKFKMKSMDVSEPTLYDITLGDEVVFPKGTPFGTRKSMLLPVDREELEFAQAGQGIAAVTFSDVAETVANFTSPEPVLNVTVRVDARGIFSVANAVLVSNETKTEGGVAGALKGLFGKKDDTEATEESEDKNATAAEKPALKKRVPIKFRERALTGHPLVGEGKRAASARLSAIKTYEAAMHAREEARNMLEGYLYKLQDTLRNLEEHLVVADFSTPAERAALQELVDETFAWLNEHAERANVQSLIGKRTAIEALEAPILTRWKEWEGRAPAFEKLNDALHAGKAFVMSARLNISSAEREGWEERYTSAEVDEVDAMLQEVADWVDELMAEQIERNKDKTLEPVILVKDIERRGREIQDKVLRIEKRRPKRKAKKVEKEEVKEEVKEKEEEETEEKQVPVHEEL